MRRHARPLLASISLVTLAACQSEPDIARPMTTPDAASEAWLAGVNLPAYLDCAREQGATLLQAHRAGDRAGAAENSLRAIQASLTDGAVFAEIDVAQTEDGVLVLMHDDTLDRTTTGAGELDDITYTDLSGIELVDLDGAPTGEPIPTLDAVLAYLDGRGIAQVDLKDISFEQVASALEAADAVDRSIVITYSMEDALALHDRLPGVMMSVGMRSLDDLETLRTEGVDLSRVTAWLGLGSGRPDRDAELARLGVETSYGDFRAEREGRIDYRRMADNGAEIISVDDVPAAAAALGAGGKAAALLQACPAART